MKACSACGNAYRKGARAFVLGKGMGNVCPACLGGGLTVVAMPTIMLERSVEKGPPQSAEVLKRLLAQARVMQATKPKDGAHADFIMGKVEGLENAIAMLKGRA